MTNLTRKLLSIYLVLGIIVFIAVIYLFVNYEILPVNRLEISHKVRLSSVRVIKNDFFDQQLLDAAGGNSSEEALYAMHYNREKEQACFLLVNETDHATYAKSAAFYLALLKPSFTVRFLADAILPLSTLNDQYKVYLEAPKNYSASFEGINLKSLLELNKKRDTLTEERTIKLSSSDKKIIIYLVLTID